METETRKTEWRDALRGGGGGEEEGDTIIATAFRKREGNCRRLWQKIPVRILFVQLIWQINRGYVWEDCVCSPGGKWAKQQQQLNRSSHSGGRRYVYHYTNSALHTWPNEASTKRPVERLRRVKVNQARCVPAKEPRTGGGMQSLSSFRCRPNGVIKYSINTKRFGLLQWPTWRWRWWRWCCCCCCCSMGQTTRVWAEGRGKQHRFKRIVN